MDMERQEFDLNEYSLEVKDGKAVVERKEKGFKDGDFLVDRYGDIFIYCVEGNTEYSHGSYVFWDKEYEELSVGFMKNMTVGVRLATDGERKFLSDRLAKEGLEWDAEKKELRKKRWRAKMGEVYYAVCVSHAVYVLDYIEGGVSFDDRCFETCNYFRTKDQAEKTAEEIRKVFEKYKEEQK